MLIKEYTEPVEVKTPQDVYNQMRDIKNIKEYFVVFYLTTRNQIIAREIISIGILNQCLIHPREVFRGAIVRNCHSIILAHNHPSGDTSPSDEDIKVTKRLQDAGDILGIEVLDHVIVGKGYQSII